jgi:hypothetical protein
VIIFDEYQKKETVDLKTRVTSNVLSDRNSRGRSRKDFITAVLTPNHNKINLEKDRAADVEPGTFLYMEIFKRQPTRESESLNHPTS